MGDLASELREVAVTLPDGAVRRYPAGVTGAEVAADISKSLEKAALAVTIDGRLADLSRPIEQDARLAIVTARDDAALELIRHDAAHIMARAVQELWPDTKVTIGPVIENGWYYDFDRAEPFTPEDLEAIEARMRQIIAARDPVRTEVWDRDRAIRHYEALGRALQGRARRGDPRGRPDPHVLARALAGPLPRPAPRAHRPGAGRRLQADVDRRRLLARRLAPADAPAHLRRRLPHPRRPRGLPAPARGGGEARPPQARPRDGPLPPAAGGAGLGLLAPERLHALADARGLHPPPARRRRLRRGEDPAAARPELWGQSGHWGKFRENMFVVPDEIPGRGRGGRPGAVGRGRPDGAEADELPRPHPDLQAGHQVLPRPAARAWPSSAAATATRRTARCTG